MGKITNVWMVKMKQEQILQARIERRLKRVVEHGCHAFTAWCHWEDEIQKFVDDGTITSFEIIQDAEQKGFDASVVLKYRVPKRAGNKYYHVVIYNW